MTHLLTVYADQDHIDLVVYAAGNYMKGQALVINDYLDAFRKRDQLRVDWYRGFGDSVFKRVGNVTRYMANLRFGFNEICFDQYGVLLSPVFVTEEVALKVNESDTNYTYVILGQGRNGMWTNAYSLSFGRECGVSKEISSAGPIFYSREEALEDVLQAVEKSVVSAAGDLGASNSFNQRFLKAILGLIYDLNYSKSQLSLF